MRVIISMMVMCNANVMIEFDKKDKGFLEHH